jgi:HAD superfamily hydrolase (TIGR01490 family)
LVHSFVKTDRLSEGRTVTVRDLATLFEAQAISHCFIDLDGTLLDGDSLPAFCFYLLQDHWYQLRFHRQVSLPLLLSASRLQRAEAFKPQLAAFFRGWPREKLLELGSAFARAPLLPKVRPNMRELLTFCNDAGVRTVLVTASLDTYCEPLARLLQMNALVCTHLAHDNGVCKGTLATPNCKGQEKLARLQNFCQTQSVDPTHACFVSDHESDIPCFSYVGLGLMVNGTATLRAFASSRDIANLAS